MPQVINPSTVAYITLCESLHQDENGAQHISSLLHLMAAMQVALVTGRQHQYRVVLTILRDLS